MHTAALFGFQQIDTPIFEETGLFVRGVGEGTDIVEKEMYSFQDKGGDRNHPAPGVHRRASCAPTSSTACTCWPQPVKLYSMGPIFRYERPQAGRFRQHHQFNVEAIGELDPAVDLEVMSVAWTLLTRLGYRGLNFQLNSTGCPECRPAYREALIDYFSAYEEQLNEIDRRRLAINPLRLLDSKEEAAQPLLNDAPHSADYLCEECATHLATPARLSGRAGDAAHDQLPAGARAGLLHQDRLRGVGRGHRRAGRGVRRRPLRPPDRRTRRAAHARHRLRHGHRAGDREPEGSRASQPPALPAPRVQVSPLGEAGPRAGASSSCASCATAGIGALLAFGGRSLKSQLKSADKANVAYTLILGEQELASSVVVVRDMASSQQETVALAGVVDWLKARLL